MKTQKEQVRNHLQKKQTITPIEALRKYGCFRLAAVIHLLRAEGLKIATETVTKNKKHFAMYRII